MQHRIFTLKLMKHCNKSYSTLFRVEKILLSVGYAYHSWVRNSSKRPHFPHCDAIAPHVRFVGEFLKLKKAAESLNKKNNFANKITQILSGLAALQ